MFEGFEKELGYEKMLQEISFHSNIQGKKSGETLSNALSALQEYADRCKRKEIKSI